MSLAAIAAVAPVAPAVLGPDPVNIGMPTGASPGFVSLLSDGIGQVQNKIEAADRMVRSFVLDDSIPVHQVSYALEQAQLSMELMMQVRSHLVETYQQLMQMQM